MSCYMRHMQGLFEALGLSYDKPNRKAVDAAIRQVLGLDESMHCPEVWAAIKALSDEERAELSARVAPILDAR